MAYRGQQKPSHLLLRQDKAFLCTPVREQDGAVIQSGYVCLFIKTIKRLLFLALV